MNRCKLAGHRVRLRLRLCQFDSATLLHQASINRLLQVRRTHTANWKLIHAGLSEWHTQCARRGTLDRLPASESGLLTRWGFIANNLPKTCLTALNSTARFAAVVGSSNFWHSTMDANLVRLSAYLSLFISAGVLNSSVLWRMVRQVNESVPPAEQIRRSFWSRNGLAYGELSRLWKTHKRLFPSSKVRFCYPASLVIMVLWMFFGLTLLNMIG